MDGEPGGEAVTPDESPWQRGSDAVFDHPEQQAFSEVTPGEDAAASAGVDRSAQPESDVVPTVLGESTPHEARLNGAAAGVTSADDAQTVEYLVDTPPPVAGRRALVGGLAAVALLVVASVVWSSRGGSPVGSSVSLAGAPGVASDLPESFEVSTPDPGNEVGSLFAPGMRSGDVAIDADALPLMSLERRTCLAQRLPDSLDLRWSAGLPGVRRVRTPVTVAGPTVLAIVGVDSPDAELVEPVALIALDAETGAIRWMEGLDFGGEALSIVGVADGIVVVEQFVDERRTHQLVAFDEETGAPRWEIEFESPWAAVIDREFGLIVVDQEASSLNDEVGETVVIDPRNGQATTRRPGRFVSIEPGPTLVTLAGSKVLGARIVVDGGLIESELLGAVERSTQPFAIVDGAFVTTFEGSTLRRAAERSATPAAPEAESVATANLVWRNTFPEVGEPGSVGALNSLGGSGIAISGSGSVFGARLDSSYSEARWKVRGLISSSTPSDRGRLLLISSDGGSVNQVVDGSTGRSIAELPLGGGSIETFAMYANGVVLLDRTVGGTERVAVDLDGRVMWTLPGRGPLAIGDRTLIEVEARSDPGGIGSEPIRLLAYGDDLAEPATCT